MTKDELLILESDYFAHLIPSIETIINKSDDNGSAICANFQNLEKLMGSRRDNNIRKYNQEEIHDDVKRK